MAGREPSIGRRRVLGAAAGLSVCAILPSSVIARSGATKQSSAAPTPDPDCFPRPDAGVAMTWERKLACYRRLAAAAREADESGWFREASLRYDREMEGLRGRERTAGEEARRAAAWARMSAAEEAFWERCTEPVQKAAVALACTPAPDLAALGAKIAAMRDEEFPTLNRMRRNCFDLLEEDVRRLRMVPLK